MEEIVVYGKKGSLVALAAASLLFAVLSVYFPFSGYEPSSRDSSGSLMKLLLPGLLYVGLPLFGLLFIYACYRLLKSTPVVIVDQTGVTDNASFWSAGLIRWEEIKKIFIFNHMTKRYIGIILFDINTLLSRQSAIKRSIIKYTQKQMSAPIAIPEDALPMSADNLLAKIQKYRGQLTQDNLQ
jgi:hypothetical protein